MKQPAQQKNEDQRVRVTKQLLADALLELLAKKPIQKISVKELCQAANINRSTFYLHYRDIYDLLAQMQEGILQQIGQMLEQNPVIDATAEPESAARLVGAIFRFVEENRQMCSILLGPAGDKPFLAQVIAMGREKSMQEFLALYPHTTVSQAEQYYSFMAWGFLGLLQYALQQPEASMQEVANSAQRMLRLGAQFYEV